MTEMEQAPPTPNKAKKKVRKPKVSKKTPAADNDQNATPQPWKTAFPGSADSVGAGGKSTAAVARRVRKRPTTRSNRKPTRIDSCDAPDLSTLVKERRRRHPRRVKKDDAASSDSNHSIEASLIDEPKPQRKLRQPKSTVRSAAAIYAHKTPVKESNLMSMLSEPQVIGAPPPPPLLPLETNDDRGSDDLGLSIHDGIHATYTGKLLSSDDDDDDLAVPKKRSSLRNLFSKRSSKLPADKPPTRSRHRNIKVEKYDVDDDDNVDNDDNDNHNQDEDDERQPQHKTKNGSKSKKSSSSNGNRRSVKSLRNIFNKSNNSNTMERNYASTQSGGFVSPYTNKKKPPAWAKPKGNASVSSASSFNNSSVFQSPHRKSTNDALDSMLSPNNDDDISQATPVSAIKKTKKKTKKIALKKSVSLDDSSVASASLGSPLNNKKKKGSVKALKSMFESSVQSLHSPRRSVTLSTQSRKKNNVNGTTLKTKMRRNSAPMDSSSHASEKKPSRKIKLKKVSKKDHNEPAASVASSRKTIKKKKKKRSSEDEDVSTESTKLSESPAKKTLKKPSASISISSVEDGDVPVKTKKKTTKHTDKDNDTGDEQSFADDNKDENKEDNKDDNKDDSKDENKDTTKKKDKKKKDKKTKKDKKKKGKNSRDGDGENDGEEGDDASNSSGKASDQFEELKVKEIKKRPERSEQAQRRISHNLDETAFYGLNADEPQRSKGAMDSIDTIGDNTDDNDFGFFADEPILGLGIMSPRKQKKVLPPGYLDGGKSVPPPISPRTPGGTKRVITKVSFEFPVPPEQAALGAKGIEISVDVLTHDEVSSLGAISEGSADSDDTPQTRMDNMVKKWTAMDDAAEDENGGGDDIKLSDNVLDNIVLAAPDLDDAITEFEKRTGIRPVPSGRLQGLGARTAVVVLNDNRYVEIIAPDPDAPKGSLTDYLKGLPTGSLEPFHYAIRTQMSKMVEGYATDVVGWKPDQIAMVQAKIDGSQRCWDLMTFYDHDIGGCAPSYVKWKKTSDHPTVRMQPEGQLDNLHIQIPEGHVVHKLLSGVDGIQAKAGANLMLCLTLRTPKGKCIFIGMKPPGYHFPGKDEPKHKSNQMDFPGMPEQMSTEGNYSSDDWDQRELESVPSSSSSSSSSGS